MANNIYKIGTCDYCGTENQILRPSPFMADASAMMCEVCWNNTKEEYMNSNGEWIPKFEDGPGFKEVKNIIDTDKTISSRLNPKYKIHKLIKYQCLNCNKEFILSQYQAYNIDVSCPYCKSGNAEAVVWMDDYDRLDQLGCMGIGHLESEGQR